MALFSLLRSLTSNNLKTKIYPFSNSMEKGFSSSVVFGKKKESDEIPKNTLEQHITAHLQTGLGHVYDKKPFKVLLKANKKYKWCTCGWSKSQPFCDGTHKIPYLKISLRPVYFSVEEDKEYYLCNCKQTDHRPFCDGAHKKLDVQEPVR